MTFKLQYDIIFIEQKKRKVVTCMKKIKWSNVLLLISVLFAVYMIASFVDVNIHNDICNPNYGDFAEWNFFRLMF